MTTDTIDVALSTPPGVAAPRGPFASAARKAAPSQSTGSSPPRWTGSRVTPFIACSCIEGKTLDDVVNTFLARAPTPTPAKTPWRSLATAIHISSKISSVACLGTRRARGAPRRIHPARFSQRQAFAAHAGRRACSPSSTRRLNVPSPAPRAMKEGPVRPRARRRSAPN